jgi:hypothetical protein
MDGFTLPRDRLDIWAIALILFVALLLAGEFGSWLRRRRAAVAEATPEESSDKSFILSGVLGLLALLTAFTFSLSLNRYEERREIVVEEANAIGTAEMRARLLSEPDNARLAQMLQDHARTRLAYGRATAAEKSLLAARSALERAQIQAAAVDALTPDARTPLAGLVGPAINAVLDVGAEREALDMAQVPGTILLVLILYNLLTAGMLGYALTGARARQRPASAALFLLLTLAIALILDLDRPQRGSIRVNQTPMQQLVDGFAPVPQATLR